MNFFLAILIYVLMAAILVAGVVAAVKGAFWLLILGLLGFVLGLTNFGLLDH